MTTLLILFVTQYNFSEVNYSQHDAKKRATPFIRKTCTANYVWGDTHSMGGWQMLAWDAIVIDILAESYRT